MSSLLFPLCTFFLLCLCIAYWASTAVYPFLFLFLLPTSLFPRSPRSPHVWNRICLQIHLKSLRFNPKQTLGWKSGGLGRMERSLVWIWGWVWRAACP